MRHRTRYLTEEATASHWQASVGEMVPYWTSSGAYLSEEFSDMLGPRSEWHPCEHVRVRSAGYARLPGTYWAPSHELWAGPPGEVFRRTFPYLPPLIRDPCSPSFLDLHYDESRLWSLILDSDNHVAGLPFIFELGKTLTMLKNPFGLIKSLAKRKRTVTTLKQVIDKASDTWLEGRYGWLPFVSDLRSAGKAYRAASEDLSKTYLTKVRLNASSSEVGTGDWDGSVTIDTSGHMVIHLNLQTALESQTQNRFDRLMSGFGLTSGDVVGAVWEEIPFSFVADWFFPVGEMIERRFQPKRWSTHSIVHVSELLQTQLNQNLVGKGYFYDGSDASIHAASTFTRFVRDLDGARGIALLDQQPTASFFNLKRTLDGVALLRNLFR